MEKFTIANGVAFRYMDTGTGEKTILLIHGYLESMEVWEKLLHPLGKQYRIIALDVPGHGISEVKGDVHTMSFLAETAAALLDKLSIKSVTAIGHSMGGYIAMAFAKSRPDLCEKLVLLHSTPDGDTPEKKQNREREIAIIEGGRKELLATTNPGKSFAQDTRKKFYEEIDSMEQQAMITEDEGIIALLKGMMLREDMNDLIDSMGERVLMIFGKKDEYMPLEYCESLIAKHPKAKVLWLENSGHCGYIEEPKLFVEGLIDFIQ